MRVGRYPERVKRDFIRSPPVTVCVVVHVPHQSNYFADRFDVVRLSLASLHAHTTRGDYNLIVLDNGSCSEVVDYLRSRLDAGTIDQLILSGRNIGKINAARMLFDAAPGEIVAYADDDVWYEENWLEAQLAVLRAFPRVGMVSARPVRMQFGYGNTYLDAYLRDFPAVRRTCGHFIPDEWEREYLHSIGRLDADAVQTMRAAYTDIMLEHEGLSAYSTAAHFQFVAPRTVILDAMRNLDQPRRVSEERQIEEAVDDMGYARLSTAGRYVRHIGNVVTPELREKARQQGLDAAISKTWQGASPAWVALARTAPLRRVLGRVNRWSYFLLNHP